MCPAFTNQQPFENYNGYKLMIVTQLKASVQHDPTLMYVNTATNLINQKSAEIR